MNKKELIEKAKKVKEEEKDKIFRCGSNAAEYAAKNAELARVLKERNSGNTK